MQIRRWNLTDAAKQCICLIVVTLKGSWLSPPRWMRLWSSFPSKQIRAGATSLYGETGPHQRPDAKTLAFRKLESKQHLCETQSTPSCLKSCCHYFQLQVLGQRCWKLVKRMISSLYSNLCTCEQMAINLLVPMLFQCSKRTGSFCIAWVQFEPTKLVSKSESIYSEQCRWHSRKIDLNPRILHTLTQ